MKARVHAFEAASRANGPGKRAVVWFQGCTLGCPGCFNPGTHAGDAGELIDTDEIVRRVLLAAPAVEGVTFSGGEPFEQAGALLEVLRALAPSPLTKLCFSGFTLDEIRRRPLGHEILESLDVLIAGRYVARRAVSRALLGSSNQEVHFLTDRYGPRDIARVPRRELILHADGSVTGSGIDPWRGRGQRPVDGNNRTPTHDRSRYLGRDRTSRSGSSLAAGPVRYETPVIASRGSIRSSPRGDLGRPRRWPRSPDQGTAAHR